MSSAQFNLIIKAPKSTQNSNVRAFPRQSTKVCEQSKAIEHEYAESRVKSGCKFMADFYAERFFFMLVMTNKEVVETKIAKDVE